MRINTILWVSTRFSYEALNSIKDMSIWNILQFFTTVKDEIESYFDVYTINLEDSINF